MDYKEKYEMALEYLQEILSSGEDSIKMSRLQLRLQGIFPELAESEDERIRKDCIKYLDWEYKHCPLDKDRMKIEKCIVWLEKQGQQKTNDRAESKFKVGDWVFIEQIDNIINGPYKIKEVNDYGYVLDSIREIALPFTSEHCMRLWTIQDSKNGDVLVDEDNNIGIYKKLEDDCWDSYIYLGCDNRLYGFSIGGSHIQNNTKPATKEQRDLLFSKMKEAGYEWDNENLVPKKIEQEWIPKTGDTIKKKETTEPLYMICNGDNYGFFCIKLMDSDSGKYYFTSETLKGYELVKRLKSTPTEEEMIEILRTEYEKGRADALIDKVEPTPIFRIGDILKRKGREYTFMVDRIQGGYYYCDRNNGAYFPIEEQDNWELVEQNHIWSEEDELQMQRIIDLLPGLTIRHNWLRSLKYRYTWKPSDEQIYWLKWAIGRLPDTEKANEAESVLEELLEDLKERNSYE